MEWGNVEGTKFQLEMMEKFWRKDRKDSGECCTTVIISLMLLICILKNG